MVVKYGRFKKETARGILNSRISGKLSDTVTELRKNAKKGFDVIFISLWTISETINAIDIFYAADFSLIL